MTLCFDWVRPEGGVVGTQRDTTDLVLRQSGVDYDTEVSFVFDFGKGVLGACDTT